MISYDDLVTCLRINLMTINRPIWESKLGTVVLRHLKDDRKMSF